MIQMKHLRIWNSKKMNDQDSVLEWILALAIHIICNNFTHSLNSVSARAFSKFTLSLGAIRWD